MCVLIFSRNFCEIFLIQTRIERDMIKKCIDIHVKYPLFLSDFNETWILSRFFKYTTIPNFTKIRPLEAESFIAYG